MGKSKRYFFSRPISSTILEAWAKICDDIARTAIVASPSPFFYYDQRSDIIRSIVGLLIVSFVCLALGAVFRQAVENRKEN